MFIFSETKKRRVSHGLGYTDDKHTKIKSNISLIELSDYWNVKNKIDFYL